MADYEKEVDVEVVEAWQQFVQIMLGILMLMATAILAIYSRR